MEGGRSELVRGGKSGVSEEGEGNECGRETQREKRSGREEGEKRVNELRVPSEQ